MQRYFTSFLNKLASTSGSGQFSRVTQNAGILFTGNVSNALIGLLYLAVLTRALTLEEFGLYALFVAYVRIIGQLCNFQTWTSLINYGSEALANSNKPLLFRLLYFGWVLDVLSGIVAFSLVLLGAVFFAVEIGLGDSALQGTIIMGVTLLFNWISTPNTLFRLHERYIPLALAQNLISLSQLFCVITLWLSDVTSLFAYLAVTAANNVLGQLFLFIAAMRLAKHEGILEQRTYRLRKLGDAFPGIREFVLAMKADTIIRTLRDIDIFIVNALLDTSAAGIYRIARKMTDSVAMITAPFSQTIYPELSKMARETTTTTMTQFMRQSSILVGCIALTVWITFLLIGHSALQLAFGVEYGAAYWVCLWCMFGIVVWGFGHPLPSALLAWRRPRTVIKIQILVTLLYLIVLIAGTSTLQLIGAGMAMAGYYAVYITAMLVTVRMQIHQVQAAN